MSQAKATPAPTSKRPPRTLAGSVPAAVDGSRAAAIASYEAALHLMQQGQYDQAQAAFDKMLHSSPPELADRIRMYINACLLNDGKYPDAREQFKQILAANPTADYAFYGLAVLASMTGDSHECLEHLTNAIKHNPRNRIQARADSDFQDMADDPRFTELLYPEA